MKTNLSPRTRLAILGTLNDLHQQPIARRAGEIRATGCYLNEVRAHMTSDREGKKFRERYRVTATSGSAGNPGVFLLNRAEWATVGASLGSVRDWPFARC